MNRKERRAAQKRGHPAASPVAATLASAFRAHQAGHRADAERLYRDVLMTEPSNAAALHLLGVLLHQSGRTGEGLSLIGQAVAIEPLNADYQYNFGSIRNMPKRISSADGCMHKPRAGLTPRQVSSGC
jgi:Flp pilus assembly protein TadD